MFSLPAALIAMAISGSPADTTLLDFYADWCGPCRSMNPVVEQLAAQGYPVRRMNVDQYRDLAQRFGITTIPCFVMIVNGREAGRVVGATSIGRLEQLCSLGRNSLGPGGAPAGGSQIAVAQAPAVNRAPAAVPTTGTSVPVVPLVYTSAPQQPPAADAAMLAASVRLRVEDPQGHSCGSGTIIDARSGGEALVLTCGHLFRDSKGTGKIEVDVYGPSPATRLPGRLVGYDLQRDIGLVAFRPQGPVMVARVAPPGYTVRPGDAVTSVGCNNGDDPTVQHSHVNSLDRFLDPVEQRDGSATGGAHPPWNLEVAGQPVIGRSGGGLFSTDGMVVGVCNAAEPVDREGLFAALGSIHSALDQQGLASLYKQSIAPPAMVPPVEGAHCAIAAANPFSGGREAAPRVRMANPESLPASRAPTGAIACQSTGEPAAATGSEQTVIDEVRRRMHDGPVKIYIVPDRENPQAKSEVIALDGDSPASLSQLAHAEKPQNIPTSMELPKRPTPVLEWDAEGGWLHQGHLP